jgi:hypothetical protein
VPNDLKSPDFFNDACLVADRGFFVADSPQVPHRVAGRPLRADSRRVHDRLVNGVPSLCSLEDSVIGVEVERAFDVASVRTYVQLGDLERRGRDKVELARLRYTSSVPCRGCSFVVAPPIRLSCAVRGLTGCAIVGAGRQGEL